MASKIIVDQLESSGSNITIPTGTGLVVTDGIAATNLSGTIADARLPTVPVAKGGTGLTSLGSAGQAIKVNSGGNALEFGAAGGGKVLQVLQAVKTDTFSTSSQSFTDVTGLSQAITPSATSSKILIICNLQVGSLTGAQCQFNLLRGSTSINIGDGSGSRTRAFAEQDAASTNSPQSVATTFLDSPNTTSATTYKIQMRVTGGTHYLNRSTADGDASYEARTTSSILLMEIGA
jgi:hypothetical protein